MRYHKFKEKIKTKSGKWRYIYDTVKSGLTSKSDDSNNVTPSDNQNPKPKKEKKQRTIIKKKENVKVKEYKQKLQNDAAYYLDESRNPSLDMNQQAYDVKKAVESFKNSKKFKDLL